MIVWVLCYNLVSRDLLIVVTLLILGQVTDRVSGLCLGHCKLFPISQLEVNTALVFQMPLVVEE